MGVIGCDYYSAYISYAKDTPGVTLAHCHAHLRRDFTNCYEHLDPEISRYGEKMLEIHKKLFEAIYAYKNDACLDNFMERQKWAAVLNREARNGPDKGKPKSIARRFGEDGTPGSYTVFTDIEGVDPTNNIAEQSIRPLVIQRYVTQGTRTERGRHALERCWSVRGTCDCQGKHFLDYLKRYMEARHNRHANSSLFS
jgi:transposase